LDVSIPLAVAAGLLSFLSPCVLPLVPGYLGHLSGQSLSPDGRPRPLSAVLLHGVCFVLGFSAIFIGLGAAATGVGRLLYSYQGLLARAGGVMIILFGLHSLGLLPLSFLYRELRWHFQPRPELSYLSSVLVGISFAAGWSPCLGLTLGAILTLALQEATVGQGVVLLAAYSAGLAVPFLGMAAAMGPAAGLLRRTRRGMRAIQIVSGLFLLLIGTLLVTGSLFRLSRWMPMLHLFNL